MVQACPSFQEACDPSLVDEGPELLYSHVGEFARHLLALHQAGQRQEFPAVANLIERLHAEGDDSVRELAAIGFLEGVQNVWANHSVSPDEFLPFLGPLSIASWHALNQFWEGQACL